MFPKTGYSRFVILVIVEQERGRDMIIGYMDPWTLGKPYLKWGYFSFQRRVTLMYPCSCHVNLSKGLQ